MSNTAAPGFRQPSHRFPSFSVRIPAFLLAVLATGISAWISIIAGIERGGAASERLAWAAVGLVLLLGAHLIPALTHGATLHVRCTAVLLWLVCMVSTGYGHATFFLAAQRHAGEARAAQVQRDLPAVPALPGRAPDAIAREQARVTRALLVARSTHCTVRCESLDIRRESLAAQLAALGTEANEARRREEAADREIAARDALNAKADAARNDPVTSRVADVLGAPRGTIDLVFALSMGWLLEGVACLGWMIALSGPSRISSSAEDVSVSSSNAALLAGSTPLRASPAEGGTAVEDEHGYRVEVTGSHAIQTGSSGRTDHRMHSVVNSELVQLTSAIADGRVRPTVKEIRRFMQCSQAKAMRLRHQFLEVAGEPQDGLRLAASGAGVGSVKPRLVHSFAEQPQAA